MTEHQRETAFLRRIILFDDSDERRKLEDRIAQVQRDARCVQRAVWLMALFTVLGAVSLGYGVVLQDNFPYGKVRFVNELVGALSLASVICLVAFLGLLMAYRGKLNRLREECRRLVAKLLESHWGKPQATPPVRRGSPARLESLQLEFVHGGNEHPLKQIPP